MHRFFRLKEPGIVALAVAAGLLTGCDATRRADAEARAAMNAAIRAEPPGDYYIGRRMYKNEYKMWGWVREPGKPWKSARLVMFNEQRTLAPDRARENLGSDNNHEYRLKGRFSGETVYEPASNRFYPEFVLESYELISTSPPNIYQQRRQLNPEVRLLQPPL
jgi:hypothetical protein